MIYRFHSMIVFNKHPNRDLKALASIPGAVLYAKAGYPNPWYVHPIVDGKIDKSKTLKPSELNADLAKRFGVIIVGAES